MPTETTTSVTPFETWRQQFPILENTTYLISNSLGAMPAATPAHLAAYADSWGRRGVRAWHEGWWEMPVEVGDLVAPLLGVQAGTVSMQPNVTLALGVVLSAIDYPPERNRIVFTEQNFPSLRYLLAGEQKRGAEIVTVPTPDGIRVELDDLLDAIDERTRLVPISHVFFRSAFVQDAAAIARRCREVGALLVLDVYQSAGVLPLALQEWGVDAAVGGCLKWLCGGPGNAFLYVRPGLDEQLAPSMIGWQSDRDPFAFRAPHDPVERGAWRFLSGTPSIPALYAAIPGLRILGELDHLAWRQRSLELTDLLIGAASDEGFELRTPRQANERGGTVTVFHPEAEALSRHLLAEDILCDYRPGAGIRLSPHFYNTEAECLFAIERMAWHRRTIR